MERTIEERLRILEDREAICELRANYCFLVDDGRFDELVDRFFTEDVACDFRSADGELSFFVAQGRENVRPFFTVTVPDLLEEMSHTVHNHRIQVEGDHAAGDCYFELTAIHRASRDEVVGAGRYVDRYRRTQSGWRFAARRAEILFIAPMFEGWRKRRFVAGLGPAD